MEIISPDINEKSKRFWGFIKSRRCDNNGVAPLRGTDGLTYSDSKKKAKILNGQFSSVFTQEPQDLDLPDMGNSPYPTMQSANVAPIFKKGDRSKAANYRPVSLTCICCKLLEHIVSSNIMQHFDNILTDAQHGFRQRRSCESQLILTVHDLAQGIEDQQQLDVILLDFSKAFDKVPHRRLLHKLNYYGVCNDNLMWISHFLADRHQCVVLNGESSAQAPVSSGVPQGTVLGPLLFLAFINHLPEKVTHSSTRLFADDCILYRKITTPEDATLLQQDLNSLQDWEKTWMMEFHLDKCQLLRVTNKRKIIQA